MLGYRMRHVGHAFEFAQSDANGSKVPQSRRLKCRTMQKRLAKPSDVR